MGELCHLHEKALARQPWFPSLPEITVRQNGKVPLLPTCILLCSTSLSRNTELCPAWCALLQLGLSLSTLPQSQGTKQEKRYLHKSGHGTRLKALLHCKAQLLYTGTGSVAPELPEAILCFLTSCGETMAECYHLCSHPPERGFTAMDCILKNTKVSATMTCPSSHWKSTEG